MKEFKGTPAPWVQNGMNGVHTPKGSCIATTHLNDFIPNDKTRLYDAKLIAAAPELLEALIEIQHEIGRTNSPIPASIQNKAVSAINKALS